jgi:hypothetical protein
MVFKTIKLEDSVCMRCGKFQQATCKLYLKARKDKCIVIACPLFVAMPKGD